MDLIQHILAFVFLLGVLVTVHELGHFLVARWSGVHVVRFSIGFGKPLARYLDSRGTEFVLAAFPLGGYVQMFDDRDPMNNAQAAPGSVPDDAVGLMSLSPYWRIAISLAGPVANFLLAIFIYTLLNMAGNLVFAPLFSAPEAGSPMAEAGVDGPFEVVSIDGKDVFSWQDTAFALSARLGETGSIDIGYVALKTGREERAQLPIRDWHRGVSEPDLFGTLGMRRGDLGVIGRVIENSPADDAGLQPRDWIIGVNGKAVETWSEGVAEFSQFANRPVNLTVLRTGVTYQLTVVPEAVTLPDGQEIGRLGIGPAKNEVSQPMATALVMGAQKTWDMSVLTLSMLEKMIFGQVPAENLMGPVGIAQVAGNTVSVGWGFFFGLMALLSISLGVLNLMPIPLLDGGHVVMYMIEIVMGRPVPEGVQVAVMQGGLVLVLMLFVFVTFNDVSRLF